MRKWLRDNNLAPGTGRAKGGTMVVSIEDVANLPIATFSSAKEEKPFSAPLAPPLSAVSASPTADASPMGQNGSSAKQKPSGGMPAHLRPPSISISSTVPSLDVTAGGLLNSVGLSPFPSEKGTPMNMFAWRGEEAPGIGDDAFFADIIKSSAFSPNASLSMLSPRVYAPYPPQASGAPDTHSGPTVVPIKQKLKATSPHYHNNNAQLRRDLSAAPISDPRSLAYSSIVFSPASYHNCSSPTARAMHILSPLLQQHLQRLGKAGPEAEQVWASWRNLSLS
jgi:hypothetical protein